ncbi:HAD-IIIC family phosphatase [Alphaproteobacteria bacterium]|nr:HAD-IIIC family phosphatase [Alphaproteobacteria bacterium]
MTNKSQSKLSASERLGAYLEAAPFPLPIDINLDHVAKRLVKDPEACALAGPAITVYVLSSFLTDYLTNYFVLMFARRGFNATIHSADYGIIAPAIFDKSHDLHTSKPDLVLILPSFRDLVHCPPLGASLDDADIAIESELSLWQSLWSNLPAPAVQLSFDAPPTRILGELDGFVPGGLTHHTRRINLAFGYNLPPSIALVDADYLGRQIGASLWDDPHMYNLCKQPFSLGALPQIADTVVAVGQGLLGKGRRVLALDLDNTLWGGVIGDDGLEGIELGPETPEGEAFTAFQNYANQLRKRGVILVVCSKNDHDIATRAFRNHPAMVLKTEDITCFVANFENKPSNLRRIAQELDLGLDSFVFIDDSPVERALMRRELPEVMTVELPENPALYAKAVEACRAFPIANLTDDDLHRGHSYKARAKTREAMASSTDMDSFLQSLEAKAVVEMLGPPTQDRIYQLLAKTNQFKLNSQTYTVEDLYKNDKTVLALRLKDRMQDYGIVAIVILSSDNNVVAIENWVMSCRVFSRRLEFVMFEQILAHARKISANTLQLTYTPTSRNGLIAGLLDELGFSSSGNGQNFTRSVERKIIEDNLPNHKMQVVFA